MKKNTLIEIEWEDIVSDSAWLIEEVAVKEPLTQCKSVGYFLNKTKEVIRLSSSIQLGKDSERDVIVIPLGVVKKIRRLK
ncbi:hypothetical protein LCGC14_3110480 [marine sediment metagenome]|uniref:Uncharacterized protein n=1 Tax=marine sediment metagenome TaxID=412755 RepID=A0A0F8YV75_9ZZZZ